MGAHISPAEHKRRKALYDRGLNDKAIGEATGVRTTSIYQWRRTRGLPPRCVGKPLPPAQRAARLVLYQLGWSDQQIANHQRLSPHAVWHWRKCLNLRPNYAPGGDPRQHSAPQHARDSMKHLRNRIRKAVGPALSRDVADDIASTIMLAILSGELPIDDLEKSARKYGNRFLDEYASKFRTQSLDYEDEEGFSMMEMIPDDRSSNWLQEMGATVW